MTDKNEQNKINQPQQNAENDQNNKQEEELSEADKKVYEQIFSTLNKIDKKVKNTKNKMQDNDPSKKGQKNITFREVAEKLIESKQNSDIVNKEDLSSDINQSFERTVIDVYSQNQRLKKKQLEMQKIIKEQNHKIFQLQTKEENNIKEIEKLKFELAQNKDQNLIANRTPKVQFSSDAKKQTSKKVGKVESNQSNEDFDFWSMPQNENYGKKKKQFVQNSGLWVNQKNIGESMFITEGRR